MSPILSSKMSWEFSKKEKCNFIIRKWQMYFQVFDYKGRHFLDLNNDNNQSICPIYSKSSTWLKYFSLSNLLCVCITRLITNYASIGKYKLRFFPNNLFAYLCGNSPIETRIHIVQSKRILSELWMINLVLFYFILLFFIFDLDKSVTWCHSHSHTIMWHREGCRRF